MNEEKMKKNIEQKIIFYKKEILPKFKFSKYRLNKLEETITYLNQYGRVYLVRLPVHRDMFKLEQQLMPDFNVKIEGLHSKTERYIDLTPKNDSYKYTDGNHLYKSSGALVTKEIGEIISYDLN